MEKKNADTIGWLVVVVLLAAAVGNYYYTHTTVLLRVVITVVLLALAVFVAVKQTSHGGRALNYWQGSLIELRKVYWPTKKETMHTTGAVLAMVAVMGMLLWMVDSILIRLVAWLLKRGGV